MVKRVRPNVEVELFNELTIMGEKLDQNASWLFFRSLSLYLRKINYHVHYDYTRLKLIKCASALRVQK